METRSRMFFSFDSLPLICVSLVIFLSAITRADVLDNPTIKRGLGGYQPLYDCDQCIEGKVQSRRKYSSPTVAGNRPDDKDTHLVAAYSDPSGAIRTGTVKIKDLSASWVWDYPNVKDHETKGSQTIVEPETKFKDGDEHPTDENQSRESRIRHQQLSPINPVKLKRQMLREERKALRTAELVRIDKDTEKKMREAAIERSRELDTTVKGKYSIWRREYEHPNSDSTLRLMRDQIIMAKAYASIAKTKNETKLYDSLLKRAKESRRAIGESSTDADLPSGAFDRAKAIGHVLSRAKDKLYDCVVVSRKLRAMLQSTEDNVYAQKKKSAFLMQLAAKTVPSPLHCLALRLATEYFLQGLENHDFPNKEKLEDPSLFHYAIFSDNVLATSVVVNSTLIHAKQPENHVFHIVTDKLNFAAMKMWFLMNPPGTATMKIENIDDFKWLNSSYCSVLRQLESARIKEYFFRANHPSTLADSAENLKYRNPKYLSMLNHLRFYLPEIYPKLEKILFLDDDVVVQKDLTPLWDVDLKGMVNGAVETCKDSFHKFDKYLNFSNPKISQNFDPNACGWAYGMNMFDLKEWKKQDITGIYHRWQDANEDRTLWKLGSLPPGLITYYNLTYPLDRSWHVLGLGYDPALNMTEIENAGVIHYNGNNKPWLELALAKYKPYWSKYVHFDNPYLQGCNLID